MTVSLRTKAAAALAGASVVLAVTLPTTALAVDAYPPGVTPVSCKIKTIDGGNKLKVNVGPNQPGDRSYRIKIDVKRNGKWYRSLEEWQSVGTKETKVINRIKGTYRAHCFGNYGFKSANSTSVSLKK